MPCRGVKRCPSCSISSSRSKARKKAFPPTTCWASPSPWIWNSTAAADVNSTASAYISARPGAAANSIYIAQLKSWLWYASRRSDYPITHNMDKSMHCSPNVFFRGKPAYLHNESYVDKVRGDEPGKGKGVVSQTNELVSHNIGKSPSVYVNGKQLVRTGDTVWMNFKKP